MSSIPLISHHLFMAAAAKTTARAARCASQVQPKQGQHRNSAIEISLDLLSSGHTGAAAAPWPMQLSSRNGPA